VERLAGVFLEVNPADPDPIGPAVIAGDLEVAVSRERLLELGDLIALRQVRIEVVLPREDGVLVNLAVKPECSSYPQLDCFPVEDRQRSGETQAHGTDV
jgi:hypothetical protein